HVGRRQPRWQWDGVQCPPTGRISCVTRSHNGNFCFRSLRQSIGSLVIYSRRVVRSVVVASACSATIVAIACATARTSQFDSAIDARNWSDAATALAADTSLLHNESTLFQAAMLYSFPAPPPYDPPRARE